MTFRNWLLLVALSSPMLLGAATDSQNALEAAKARYKEAPEAGNQAMRELLNAHPGDVRLARAALREILARSRDLPQWSAYAGKRIVALQEIGAIPWEDDMLAQVYGARIHAYLRDDHRLSAKILIEEAVERFPGNNKVRAPDGFGRHEAYAHQAPPPETPMQHVDEVSLNKDGWLAFRRSNPAQIPEDVDKLIAANAEDSVSMHWDDDSGHVSGWTLIDLHLQKQSETLDPLRDLQEKLLQEDPDNLSLEAIQLFRRFPWADTAHRRLTDAATAALMQGRPQAAYRSFVDVRNHSRDPELKSRAIVGQLLALAAIGDAQALAATFDALDSKRQMPWMGKTVSVTDLRKRIHMPDPVKTEVPKLTALKVQTVVPPPIVPWVEAPTVPPDLQAVDDHVLLSGRHYLAAYEAKDTTRPKWIRSDESGVRSHDEAPGGYRPAVVNGTVYARTIHRTFHRYHPYVLSAIDLASGNDLWSIGNFNGHAGNGLSINDAMIFHSRPAIADNTLFALTTDLSAQNPKQHVSVLAVDPSSRRILWRSLSKQSPGYTSAKTFGIEPTIHQGVAYAVPSSHGVHAVDLRDGRILWTHRYELDLSVRLAKIPRHATPAIVVDDRLICSPFDTGNTFALELKTGRLLWRNPYLASRQQIGRFGDTILVRDGHTVAAIAAEDGAIRWHQRFDSRIAGRVQFVGDRIFVSTAKAITAISAADGSRLDQRHWDLPDGPPRAALVADGRLFAIGNNPFTNPRQKTFNPVAPKQSAALKPPLQLAWQLPVSERNRGRVMIPPADSSLSDKVYYQSMGILSCVAATPQGGVNWERFSPILPDRHYFIGNLLIMQYRHDFVGFDASSGQILWQRHFNRALSHVTADGENLWAFGGHGDVAVLNPRTGKAFWQQRFEGVRNIRAIRQHGHLHVFGNREGKLVHFVLDLVTGKPLHEYDDLIPTEKFDLFAVSLGSRGAILYGAIHKPKRRETAFAYAMDGKKSNKELVNARHVETFGDYAVTFVWHDGKRQETVLRKISDPAYELKLFDGNKRDALFDHEGDRLAVFDGGHLLLVDLSGKKILHDSAVGKHQHYRGTFVVRDGRRLLFAMPFDERRKPQPSYFVDLQSGKTTEAPHAVLAGINGLRLSHQRNSPKRIPAYQNGLLLTTDKGLQLWAPSK